METRKIGSLDVSIVGIGCNNFGMRVDAAGTKAVVDAALEAGVTFFDTADVYGMGLSEQYLGEALGQRRDGVVIATKFGAPMGDGRGASAAYVEKAVEASLSRLGTDRIDLYQLHMPDDSAPIEETLEALDSLVKAGKVREIGCSNFGAARIDAAREASASKGLANFVSVQNHYNLLHRDDDADAIPACERHEMGFLPYFPLASGLLTGKYHRGEEAPEGTRLAMLPPERKDRVLSDRNFDKVESLDAFARERGYSLLDLAVSWLASRRAISSVIAGATKPEQVRANVAAASWQLTEDDLKAIDTL